MEQSHRNGSRATRATRITRGALARAVGYALGAVAACPLAGGATLAAQIVRGVVTERASTTPVAGVLLTVVDARGAAVVQALSDDRGEFEIRLPGAGTYSVDAKRIGVRRLTLAPFTIAAGETRRVDIAVEPLPAVLSSVRVTGRTSCVRNPATNRRTAALWEDARAALTAAVITRNQGVVNDSVIRFERKLDVQTWRVLYENRRRISVSMDRPFRSLPAEDLSAIGYVHVGSDGTVDYYAPDAEVLLSDAFLVDHCFRLKPADLEHPGYVGLGFEPVPGRKTPDVKGVLWMDEKTAELRMLEFTYTWLPYDLRPVDFGGTVHFFRLPGGRWIVRSWRIRMPEYGHERYVNSSDGSYVSVGRSVRPQLVRIAEEGGAVPLDVLLAQAGTVHGTVVVDTVSNKPIAGITVALEGTADSTHTAMDGTFELPFVQPGSYTVVLRHPVLDSLGLVHFARTVDVDLGASPPVNLRFPTNDELAASLCDARVDFSKQAIIRFLVVDGKGAPLANTPAVLARAPIGGDGRVIADSAAAYDITLDANGGFLGCGLRGDEVVRVEGLPDTGAAWGETVRPRTGTIGWHVIRGKRKP